MLFYLPLNVYTGYFSTGPLLLTLLRDVLIDGTVYHLWYLPAAMAGAAIAWGLLRRGGFRLAFPVTLVLYAAGLLGDSYYGLAQGLPPLAWLYDRLFEVCDYTRNGLLFAPLFFVMGGWFARRRPERGTGVLHFCAFLLALAAMVAEGLLLRSLGMPRHDSMYVLLPVCLFFLFSWLSGLRGRRLPLVRTAALLVYILHPMVIGSGALCREIHRSDRTVGGQHLCAFFDGHGVVDGGGVRACGRTAGLAAPPSAAAGNTAGGPRVARGGSRGARA